MVSELPNQVGNDCSHARPNSNVPLCDSIHGKPMTQTGLTESVEKSVEQSIASVWPIERWGQTTTIVAVSGGADSIALLHALVKLNGGTGCSNLVVAHVNHGTRGEASEADAHFVRAEAKKLSLPFHLGTRATNDQVSRKDQVTPHPSESSLREFRYRCLREAAHHHGARYLVTGHTLDDQIETVLFRIFRGTGLRGLAGIPAFRKLDDQLTLVRPMLAVTRAETQAYVATIGRTHRVDASNEDSQYTRNFLRNELMPLARKKFPDIDRAIARLSEAALDHQNATSELAVAARRCIIHVETSSGETGMRIDCRALATFPASAIINSLIDQWDQLGWPRGNINRETWNQVAQLIRSTDTPCRVINLPGNIRAERVAHSLMIAGQHD